MPEPRGLSPSERMLEKTALSPTEEMKYKKWIHHYKLNDVDPKTDEPYEDVKYDLRGYWRENQGPDGMAGFGPPQFDNQHGPDTYKQHGHPTFSQESQYSKGPSDGGMWVGSNNQNQDVFLEQPTMAVSHQQKKKNVWE